MRFGRPCLRRPFITNPRRCKKKMTFQYCQLTQDSLAGSALSISQKPGPTTPFGPHCCLLPQFQRLHLDQASAPHTRGLNDRAQRGCIVNGSISWGSSNARTAKGRYPRFGSLFGA
ncbi:hypothetical protein BB8028_0007g03770 [Beauveria bassiana]|uniref:Uncharacterized protein n=1 Tax=Beauveria bassiana TaxID=176275 RepID=A0A2S7YLW5_BEABA|nr:hypothetical protein BB8028_0007g03770 [Beauveria bassiana]